MYGNFGCKKNILFDKANLKDLSAPLEMTMQLRTPR
jgi:hypothetical protein